MLVVGLLAVVLQVTTVVGVLIAAASPSCANSDMCKPGAYCKVVVSGRCEYCAGSYNPIPTQVDEETGIVFNYHSSKNPTVFNLSYVEEVCAKPFASTVDDPREYDDDGNVINWAVEDQVSWCESCLFADGTVDTMYAGDNIEGNVEAMTIFDFITLVLASLVSGLSVCGELRDIELCKESIRQASASATLGTKWRTALSLLHGVRRWALLPLLVLTPAMLAMVLGGDAQSVCFNAVALLFLLELDNALYLFRI